MESKGNILIVDDNPANLQLLSQMLLKEGYRVRPVLDGERALAATYSQLPDLILLDVMMPEMDGYEVCAQLKAKPDTRDIPIIFISALNAIQDKIKAFKAGGVDYINKPFQMPEVLARVETHLALRRLQQQLEAANTALNQQNKVLQAQNEELDAFAHTVAHDLKNPLGMIIGYGDILSDYTCNLDEQGEECVIQLQQAATKMNDILDALLLLASVRKRQEIPQQPLEMGAIVEEALSRLKNEIADQRAEITLPESWPNASGYAPWIEEVWFNYLSNGLKYGGDPANDLPPHITLGYSHEEDGWLRFWVQDNGPGLIEAEQTRLFTPFERPEQAQTGGYGLGLSIVRRIVKRLGGRVGVISAPGEGSTFYFELPALMLQ